MSLGGGDPHNSPVFMGPSALGITLWFRRRRNEWVGGRAAEGGGSPVYVLGMVSPSVLSCCSLYILCVLLLPRLSLHSGIRSPTLPIGQKPDTLQSPGSEAASSRKDSESPWENQALLWASTKCWSHRPCDTYFSLSSSVMCV